MLFNLILNPPIVLLITDIISFGSENEYLLNATIHFAEETDEEDPELNSQCGENAYYSFDKATGTLTIGGTGNIYNYTDYKRNEE